MDFFTWNRIAGTVLVTALYVVVLRIGAEALYHVEPPEQPAYIVEGLEDISAPADPAALATPAAPAAAAAPAATAAPAAAATAAAPAAPVPIPEIELPDFASAISSANIANGQMIAEPCAFCHNWEEGDGNLIGPNLYGVVGGARASVEGFNYSPAFQSLNGVWTYAELFAFLEQPSLYAPGTLMAFAGISGEQDRLDLIAYMRSWSANPAPISPPMPAPQTPAP